VNENAEHSNHELCHHTDDVTPLKVTVNEYAAKGTEVYSFGVETKNKDDAVSTIVYGYEEAADAGTFAIDADTGDLVTNVDAFDAVVRCAFSDSNLHSRMSLRIPRMFA
jgi:hypothetical protein